jgi:CopA family copper-resistance protein
MSSELRRIPRKFAADRRQILRGAMTFGAASLLPGWAQSATPGLARPTALSGEDIHLTIGHAAVKIDGKAGHAVAINGTVPGPLIRLKQGQNVRLHVTNNLAEDTSIHWHGLLVPFHMDGVPGVSFPGIKPGETFTYEFPVIQSGTYWYHSHSGLQEQEGHYAPIVIDPPGEDPVAYDREHVIVLSDYSFTHPHVLFQRLKGQGGVFNFQKQTFGGLLAGRDQTWAERREWAAMRMDPTDISDITGAAYRFLVNGHGFDDNWTALFTPGERVRLRFVNAAAQTIFNIRIPGLKLTIVAADGQLVRPVEVDEFQIGNAETYDLIVQPTADQAYTLVSEAVDRSGMGRATLAPRPGMSAPVPPLRKRPLTTMKDMGMDHSSMEGMGDDGVDHAAMGHAPAPPTPPAQPGMAAPKPRGSDLMGAGMEMNMLDQRNAPQLPLGPGVQMIAPMPTDRTNEPGQGLESVGHRVLVYRDLIALEPNPDSRAPSREMEIRLTGNMERFMWGFDGKKYSERPAPYMLRTGERVRITLVNDTMMTHPIHMHGHFFELIHGPVGHMPRKHTVNVLPGGKVTFDVTGEAGDWAFHCHMMYHMHAGMFQVFKVRDGGAA